MKQNNSNIDINTNSSDKSQAARMALEKTRRETAEAAEYETSARRGKRYHGPLPVDDEGYYGDDRRFGGMYVPEALKSNLEELADAYYDAIADPAFMAEYRRLLRDYVGRPSALYFAPRLSEHFGAKIYLKREDLNHTGAHKINNAIGLALLARRMGKKRVIAETGAGQHGVATATVAAMTGMQCTIYMGAVDVERQRPNVERMRMLGAEVVPVTSGGATLQDAVNEALAAWVREREDTFYLIGSAVGPHPFPEMVTFFQSVISEEILHQIPEQTGKALPDYVIACVGGGSNAGGAFYHFINRPDVRLIAVEAAGHGIESGEHAATMTVGRDSVLHGSRTLVVTDADGDVVAPYSISAGLDYPGVGPLQAHLAATGRTRVLTATDEEALEAAYLLTRLEGIIPAMESSHALAALAKIDFDPDDIVVVNVSGRGDKDLSTFLEHRHK